MIIRQLPRSQHVAIVFDRHAPGNESRRKSNLCAVETIPRSMLSLSLCVGFKLLSYSMNTYTLCDTLCRSRVRFSLGMQLPAYTWGVFTDAEFLSINARHMIEDSG